MMQEAMKFLVDFQFQRVQRYDLELSFKDERTRDAVGEIRRLPGVDYAEPVLYVPCTFINGPHRRRGAVHGLEPASHLTLPRDGEGRRVPIPPDGLAMSRALAERLHVSTGDTILIRPNKGLRQERRARVAHIVDGYIGMTVYADIAFLNRLVNEEAAVNAVQLQLDGDPRHRRNFYSKLKELPAIESVYSRQDTRRLLEEVVIKTQRVMIGILVGFAGVIFFGSLLNASLVSLAERQAEVATLRVLGYGPWEVGGMFLRESMLVNLVGTLLGLPLGYGLATAMVNMYENEMFRIPVVFTAEIVAQTLIAAAVFGLLAHAFVQRSIHKMNWLEALKVKE
jgi:putative ABC transport system permease protein